MKTTRIHLLIALVAAATASAATPPPPAPLLVALDSNHDGALSPLEIKKSSVSLTRLDKNGDGQLTRKELLPPPPTDGTTPPPPPARPSALMVSLDLDANGILSAGEIEDAPLSLRVLDKNKDGRITHKELNPPPPVPAT